MFPIKCVVFQVACNDGKRCLPRSFECDGVPDCEDDSDEHTGCPYRSERHGQQAVCAGPAEFQCEKEASQCLAMEALCDGHVDDCRNGSDEPDSCFDVDSADPLSSVARATHVKYLYFNRIRTLKY